MKHQEKAPIKCESTRCAANRSGYCYALKSNSFGDKTCPFFKLPHLNEKERQAAVNRLVILHRTDLIDKYYCRNVGDVDGC